MADDSSIGDVLKNARLERKISIEQVADDTYISLRLIEALEEEKYDEFTSEIYLVGFLKTYAEYLGLDSEYVIRRFRNIRVQEQPTPITELLQKKPFSKKAALLVIVIVITIIGAILLFSQSLLPNLFERGATIIRANSERGAQEAAGEQEVAGAQQETAGAQFRRSNVYTLDDEAAEITFSEGDKIGVTIDERFYLLEVGRISRSVRFVWERGDAEFSARVNEEIAIDLDQNGQQNIALTVASIERDSVPPQALVRISRIGKSNEEIIEEVIVENNNYGATSVATRRKSAIQLGEYDGTAAFPVEISFTSAVFLQYQIDNEERVSKLYSPADSLFLNPEKQLLVWATNAGAINFNVSNRFIPIGSLGEVTSFAVEKHFDSGANRDTLRIVPLY